MNERISKKVVILKNNPKTTMTSITTQDDLIDSWEDLSSDDEVEIPVEEEV